jgi:molybdate transport system substrate-binding protein
MRGRWSLVAAAAAASLALGLGGCASGPGPGAGENSTSAAAGLSGELRVYAAASLKASFDELARAFAADNPGVEVVPIVYDGSSTLATQIAEGAPANVFASANEANMAKAVDAGLTADPRLFATNTLVVVVPAGNPGGVTTLADLADPDLTVVLCAAEVPCGDASRALLADQRVTVTAASYEQNVTAVLTKVAGDIADAGLVYATDVIGDAEVESFEPEGADAVVNRYPIVALRDAPNPEVAQAFVDFVLGPQGRAVLTARGFGTP